MKEYLNDPMTWAGLGLGISVGYVVTEVFLRYLRKRRSRVRVYLTEYVGYDGKTYGDQVEALSWAEAEDICVDRRRGEKVVGKLHQRVPL